MENSLLCIFDKIWSKSLYYYSTGTLARFLSKIHDYDAFFVLYRTVMVRLSSLIVLLGSLFLVISECIQPVVDTGDQCTISSIANTFTNTSLNITQTCPQVSTHTIQTQYMHNTVILI